METLAFHFMFSDAIMRDSEKPGQKGKIRKKWGTGAWSRIRLRRSLPQCRIQESGSYGSAERMPSRSRTGVSIQRREKATGGSADTYDSLWLYRRSGRDGRRGTCDADAWSEELHRGGHSGGELPWRCLRDEAGAGCSTEKWRAPAEPGEFTKRAF